MKQLRECLVDSLKKRFKFVEKQRYYTFVSLIDPSINLKSILSKLIFKSWLFSNHKLIMQIIKLILWYRTSRHAL